MKIPTDYKVVDMGSSNTFWRIGVRTNEIQFNEKYFDDLSEDEIKIGLIWSYIKSQDHQKPDIEVDRETLEECFKLGIENTLHLLMKRQFEFSSQSRLALRIKNLQHQIEAHADPDQMNQD